MEYALNDKTRHFAKNLNPNFLRTSQNGNRLCCLHPHPIEVACFHQHSTHASTRFFWRQLGALHSCTSQVGSFVHARRQQQNPFPARFRPHLTPSSVKRYLFARQRFVQTIPSIHRQHGFATCDPLTPKEATTRRDFLSQRLRFADNREHPQRRCRSWPTTAEDEHVRPACCPGWIRPPHPSQDARS